MATIVMTVGAALVLLTVVFCVWGGIHLLAQSRFGLRILGCRGPVPDPEGNLVCCKGVGPCEEQPAPSPEDEAGRS